MAISRHGFYGLRRVASNIIPAGSGNTRPVPTAPPFISPQSLRRLAAAPSRLQLRYPAYGRDPGRSGIRCAPPRRPRASFSSTPDRLSRCPATGVRQSKVPRISELALVQTFQLFRGLQRSSMNHSVNSWSTTTQGRPIASWFLRSRGAAPHDEPQCDRSRDFHKRRRRRMHRH